MTVLGGILTVYSYVSNNKGKGAAVQSGQENGRLSEPYFIVIRKVF